VAAIEAHNLTCAHAPGRGVCGVSLAVDAGECYAVLGRNGSGKSTLTRLLLGLEPVGGGSLAVLGLPVARGSRRHLGRLGVCLDTSAHWEALSGWQNACFVAQAYGRNGRALEGRLAWLFDRAGLAPYRDEPVATYSFGMRRKLALVEAFCHEPELAVLDEPTAGVDEQFVVELADLLRQRGARGQTTWIASNDVEWAACVASRVAFLEAGRLVAEGTPEGLIREVSPLCEVHLVLAGSVRVPPPALDGVRAFSQDGTSLRALIGDSRHLPRLLEHVGSTGAEVARVEVARATLRDAFLLKTGRELGP